MTAGTNYIGGVLLSRFQEETQWLTIQDQPEFSASSSAVLVLGIIYFAFGNAWASSLLPALRHQ
jgi:hypothetical protein